MSLTSAYRNKKPRTVLRTVKHSNATKAQYEFWTCPAEYRLFVGGRGSGKTRGGAVEALRMPANSRGMVIAPTYMMLRDGAIATLLELAQRANILESWNATHYEMTLLGNRKIFFRSAEHVDRIRGNNVGWLWFDEMAYCKKEVWTVALGTRRASPMKVFATTTPNGMDWVYELWHNGDPEQFAIIRSPTADNVFVPPSYVEALRSQMTEEMFRQEGLGEFINPSGMMFNRSWFTITEEIPTDLQWYRYWDLAMTTKQSSDYTASASVALDSRGILYVRDVIRTKSEYPEVKRLIVQTMLQEPDTIVGIEEAVSGYAAIQELRRLPEIANITLRGVRVDKDKKTRAMPWSAKAEQGLVALQYDKNWNRMFLDEVASFPNGIHDDMVDSVSGALGMISQRKLDWGIM